MTNRTQKVGAGTPSNYRWVSCSQTEFGPVGRHRHLAKRRALTTFCGNTASVESIWRSDSRKPKCPTCAEAERRIILPVGRS